jgi:hypothetical protein
MARTYKRRFKDNVKDTVPSVSKTVSRVVYTIIELFFTEANQNVRDGCVTSLSEILENCFTNKKYGK